MRESSHPLRGGFTLAEGLTALVVAGIVIVALYAAITSGFLSVRLARENARATQIILEKMELIRLLTWDQLQSGVLPTRFTAPYHPGRPGQTLEYTGAIAVEPVNPATRNYHPDLRKVTVTLYWNSGAFGSSQRVRSRQLSTYVARYGIQNYVVSGNQGG